MPDNGNLTDKLSIEISASVDPAIKAIDTLQTKLNMLSGSLQHFTDAGKYKSALDNMAKGFERLTSVIGGIDFDALANVSSGINNASKAMGKFSDATRNIEKTFSGTTKSAGTLANVVERELTQEFNKLGITGDKEIKELSEGFADLGKTFNDMTDGVPGAWDATEAKLGEMKQKLRDMSSIADDTAISMKDVLAVYNDIRGQQANSVRLPKGISTMYSGGDGSWMGMRQTVGAVEGQGRGANIFAPQEDSFKNLKAINFEAFYSDLQSAHGQRLFPDLNSDEEQFMRLYEVMRMAKGEIDSLSEGGNTLKISLEEAEGKAFDFAQAAGNIAKNFQSVETTTQEGSGFSQMLESLKSLGGVTIPDLSGLNPISSLASKIGGDKGTAVSDNLTKIFDALRSSGGNLSIPDFSGLMTLAKAVEKLGNGKSQNATWVLPNVMAELESFSGHFNGLSIDTNVISTISQLGSAFSRLGGRNATEAITNLPQLSDAIRQVVDDLNNLPQVSQQTQDLIVALGQLARSHTNVANATKGVSNSHNVASQALQKFTSRISSAYNSSNFLASAYNKVKDGVTNFTQSMDRASSHTQSLTMVIVKARTLLWGFRRIFSMFSGSLELASSLTEVQNVIDNVFTENYADKIEDMSKAVKESLGMSELSFKQYASRYQAMGKAMGITNNQMISAQDNLKGMGVAYGEANGNMQDMSVNLTRLAADLASFYDIDQKVAYEKLQAIYTGQSRPLRSLGIDLTQATLQEWMLKQGIDGEIASMTQAQKTMIRYQYVLSQTTAAHGDFARTIGRMCAA